ncbi:rhomboid family intramembrane serine protease [Aquibacillus sp. 3ASR75-11]|uniref:Rhomboid family intramembrane serine protease n=1 Tax=Terrihalobacillus insolitus TaxID=2950438 RepID=A0A9X4ANX3_9BACI|nr:rhomboid family intramembrane serine protease [Terrihalobacillus insolitus]MDC3413390.1 rhomboid family intramembrane serine protease [Terrihalobacillus insolitus]MDC3424973.1 rhomboid family intramembrane serine protease [Terrihalobacillus insolitus]
MTLEEEFLYYYVAYDLVVHHKFDIIRIGRASKELWLEKKVANTSHVVRLSQKGFDWNNQMIQDLEQVQQEIKRLKKTLTGKSITFHSVYISAFPPVNGSNTLSDPIKVKDMKSIQIQVYFSGNAYRSELKRLYQDLTIPYQEPIYPTSEVEITKETAHLKEKLIEIHNKRTREIQSLFENGKPIFTYLFLLVNVAVFILLEINGGSMSTATLIKFGAKYNPAILEGEWWRIVSSMFLHIGYLHIAMNMLALFYLGNAVERIYGSARFFIIYFLAGIIGGLASFALSPQLAAGASGALFGLFGALLFFGVLYKKVFFQTMGKNLLFIIGLNIVLGLSLPQIDNSAHIGGLIGGFIAASIVFLPKKKKRSIQLVMLLVYVAAASSLIVYGTTQTSPELQLQVVQQLIKDGDYKQTIDVINEQVENSESFKAEFLFYRSFAFIKLNKQESAISDLEQTVQLKPEFAEAQYNLALLYFEKSNLSQARDAAEKAYNLQPDNEDFKTLYNQLEENG